jgi:SPP1 family predicted phage head-tail adaptor
MLQAKDVRRGQLDREITFIKRVITRGNANQDKVSWARVTDNPTVFSRVKELPGNEVVIGNQIKFIQKTEFVVVYRTDITAKHRLVFEDRVYEIISVIETAQRKMYTQVMANYLDNEVSPILGGFAPLAFSSGFRI